MTQRWQYPVKAEPVLPENLFAEEVTLDKWYSPLAKPARRITLAAALIASSGVVADPKPIAAEVIPDFGWLVPFSEPAPAPPPRQPGEFTVDPVALTLAEAAGLDKWFVPLSEPVRPRHQTRPGAFLVDTELGQPEVTTPDKWFVAFSEPPAPRARAPDFPAVWEGLNPVAEPGPGPAAIEWFRSLSEPVLPEFNPARLVAGTLGAVDIPAVPVAPDCFEDVETLMRDTPVDAEGLMASTPIDAKGPMSAFLDLSELMRDTPVDSEGAMSDTPVDAKGDLCE